MASRRRRWHRPASRRKTGTKITFKPDPTIMDATRFQFRYAGATPAAASFLNKGLKITLSDERGENASTEEFFYSGGIAEFIKHLNRGKAVLHEKPIHFEGEREMPNGGKLTMEVALQYNDSYSENVFSFANNINTVDGGSHLSGFRSALTRTINAAAAADGLVQGRQREPDRRRRARRLDRGGQRETAATPVRRPDQGQAQLRYSGTSRRNW